MMHPIPLYAQILAMILLALLITLFVGGILGGASKPCPKCDNKNCEEDCDK